MSAIPRQPLLKHKVVTGMGRFEITERVSFHNQSFWAPNTMSACHPSIVVGLPVGFPFNIPTKGGSLKRKSPCDV